MPTDKGEHTVGPDRNATDDAPAGVQKHIYLPSGGEYVWQLVLGVTPTSGLRDLFGSAVILIRPGRAIG